jgi:2-iminobutanoate/2-iminopropanoate deaminase
MTPPAAFDVGVAHRIGRYADVVRVPAGHDLIVTSGTPGLLDDGTLPAEFTDEAVQAWRNVERSLAAAGARLADVVQVRQWLTSADDIKAYAAVRSGFITHEPAFMLAVVPGLVWPNIRLEIEVVAAVPAV